MTTTPSTTPAPAPTVGRINLVRYEKFGPRYQFAPNGLELAELYDKAARQIELLVHALKLSCPLTPAAQQARDRAFDAVMEDMKS